MRITVYCRTGQQTSRCNTETTPVSGVLLTRDEFHSHLAPILISNGDINGVSRSGLRLSNRDLQALAHGEGVGDLFRSRLDHHSAAAGIGDLSQFAAALVY